MRHSDQVETLWPRRLRWRMRGAWLWPAFFAFTLLDGILLTALPPYAGAPSGIVGGVLLAGFANLALIAVAAPVMGILLRRRRPDLPRPIAADYAGTALTAGLAALVLVGGILHRPAVAAEREDRAAVYAAIHDYVLRQAPDWGPGLTAVDTLRLTGQSYRTCVPGRDPARWLCLYVDTDQSPPGVRRDGSMEPNSTFRTVGGFH